ncbi:DUF6795 domain-containing protein [Marinobacter sp.]|uniref:DUF6795 domain-containing protein n=1 Tax=Marinobacter sp. TaxID=50741 RepID=UPI003A8C8C1A
MSIKSHSLLLPPAIALLFLAGMVIPHEANAGMFDLITQFFKKYDVHLSPEVHGSVRNNGVPLENVEVYRTLDYDIEYRDTILTDSNGQFSFPEKIIKSRRPGQLFDETRIRQIIGLVYEDEKYLLWYLTDDIGPYRAIAEKLATLNCDLSTPEEVVVFKNLEFPSFNHAAATICRWN